MFSRDKDISRVLKDWLFDASKVNVRRILGEDGKEKIQLRLDLGILQMEVNGRPDGKRPFGKESLLDYYLSILDNRRKHGYGSKEFKLSREDCANLQQEAIQYYHRYLSLFHLLDYEGVVRDTKRNLRVFDLMKEYAEDPHDRRSFEPFRPYVIMMRTRAEASIHLKKKNYGHAIEIIQNGINELEKVIIDNDLEPGLENSPELAFLRRWLNEIKDLKPIDPVSKLKRELDAAIKVENYELAAKLRDQINSHREPFSFDSIFNPNNLD